MPQLSFSGSQWTNFDHILIFIEEKLLFIKLVEEVTNNLSHQQHEGKDILTILYASKAVVTHCNVSNMLQPT